MPAPIIDTTTSVLGFRQGEHWQFQPATTNAPAPTSWAWAGLPDGVSANTTTGKITGPATVPGVYLARVTATNGDGTSAPLVVPIGIFERRLADDGAVLVNCDVRTGLVYPHGVANWKSGEPVIYAKSGDHVVIDVGFTADGGESMLMIDPTWLQIVLKETDPRGPIDLSDGQFTTMGEWDRTRYRVVCYLDDAKVRRALRKYEGEGGTEFGALTEIKWQQTFFLTEGSTDIHRSSRTFETRLTRALLQS
jgi:hypothetical protein